MSYNRTVWENDSTPAINANNLNKIEQGIYDNSFESGSNANGNYIKFNDGTMICYKTVTGSVEITTAWGSLYEGALALGDWAASFTSAPNVNITNVGTAGAIAECFSQVPTATSAGSIFLTRPNSTTTNVTLSVMAIGRWK